MKFLFLMILLNLPNLLLAKDSATEERPRILAFSAEKTLFHALGIDNFSEEFSDLDGGNCVLKPTLLNKPFRYYFDTNETVVLFYDQHPERPACTKINQVFGVFSNCVADRINFFRGSPYCYEVKSSADKMIKMIINFDASGNLNIDERDLNSKNLKKSRILIRRGI